MKIRVNNRVDINCTAYDVSSTQCVPLVRVFNSERKIISLCKEFAVIYLFKYLSSFQL